MTRAEIEMNVVFLLFLFCAFGLRLEPIRDVTLYFEISGAIAFQPGDCDYPNPYVPLLRCNISTYEPAYLQVKSDSVVGVKIKTNFLSKNSSFGNAGTYMGPGCYRIQINRWIGKNTIDWAFSEFGKIPNIDENTLQIQFVLLHDFYY